MSSDAISNVIKNDEGRNVILDDWYNSSLPDNLRLDDTIFIDTAYSFRRFRSLKINGFTIDYGSGSYGQSNFIGGKNSQIKIGKYVVLQGTNIICNDLVEISDHCMFSWGSVITDSWVSKNNYDIESRRNILVASSKSGFRNFEFDSPDPVIIEENVWVGFKAIILPGVTLGKGCVVASNCVVDINVPPYAVIAGNPARIIKYLDADDTEDVKIEVLKNISGINS